MCRRSGPEYGLAKIAEAASNLDESHQLRCLDAALSDQQQKPEAERVRVALKVDEAHLGIFSHKFAELLALGRSSGLECVCAFQSPSQIPDLLGHESAHRIAGIVAQHVPVVDVLPGPFLPDDPRFDYDFSVRMPTATGRLDHIRDECR